MAWPFSEFVKALVTHRACQRAQLITNLQILIRAARHLENAWLQAGACHIEALSLRHFEIAEASIVRSVRASTAYRVAQRLEQIASEMDSHRLTTRRIGYRCRLRRPAVGDKLDEESQKLGMAKMPSERALECLADISNSPADDNERILLRHADLLVATGFRIGECLTLPFDCWVEETIPVAERAGETVTRCGIRYWPEKGGDPIVKWLPTSAVPLARRAVQELQKLCAPAREVASWLEQHPGHLPCFAGLDPERRLSTTEVAKLLETTRDGAEVMLRTHGVKSIRPDGVRHAYIVNEVESALAQRIFNEPILIRSNGRRQMLSQSLSVAFKNQFHGRKATLRWVPVAIRLGQIQELLGGGEASVKLGIVSAFSRRGLTDETGNRLRIKTHAFRHWLNTLANRGGLSDVELARWMGRRDLKQNEAYKHGTVQQRTQWAREMIATGSLAGPVARVAQDLPDDEREKFLDAAVEAVHFTPYGVCVHNFAASPCEYHLACFRGCPDYLRHKGNVKERQALLRLREDTLVTLKKVRTADAEPNSQKDGWVRHAEATLRGLDAALAVDNDLVVDDGTRVSVFIGGTAPKGGQ